MTNKISRLIVLFLFLALSLVSLAGAAAEPDLAMPAHCSHSEKTWDCFGELEVIMLKYDWWKQRPIVRIRIQRFRNGEVRAEREFFGWQNDASKGNLGIYFSVMPSRVELFYGWKEWQVPKNLIENERAEQIDVLQTVIPNGPNSISRNKQRFKGIIKRNIRPFVSEDSEISVSAWMTDGGEIKFQYTDFGGSVGKYEVVGTWWSRMPEPLPDERFAPGAESNVGRKFGSLGEARSITTKP